MSSGRHWNLKRHLARMHGGAATPIGEYTFQHQPSTNLHPFNFYQASNPYFVSKYFQDSRYQKHESSDSMEEFLESLRKINELKNLTSQLLSSNLPPIKVYPYLQVPSSTIDFTSRQPVRIQNEYNTTSPNSTKDPEIIGYRGYVCLTCLTAEPLPIYGDNLVGVEKAVHECNTERLEEVSNLINRDEIIRKLYAQLPERMKDVTNVWTKCKNHIIALKIEEAYTAVDKITELTINDNNSWAVRVIRDGRTILSDEELMAFFKASNNSTSAYFKIQSYQPRLFPSCYLIAISQSSMN